MTDVTPEAPDRAIRVVWRDSERPWPEHWAEWVGGRVPVAGEYIDLPGEGAVRVKVVLWDLAGSCVIRMEQHPR